MNHLAIPLAYGAAVVFVCGLSAAGTWDGPRSARNAFPVATLLLLEWVATNACHALPREIRTVPYPYMDTAGAVLCITLWHADMDEVSFWSRAWQLALSFTFLTEVFLHAVTPEPWREPRNSRYAYDLSLNLVFVVQLLLGSSPGAIHVGARIRDHLRHYRHRGGVRGAMAR